MSHLFTKAIEWGWLDAKLAVIRRYKEEQRRISSKSSWHRPKPSCPAQAGVDLPTVKRISGHKTLQMVERYSHQNGAHIQAEMDKLDQRYRTKENV